MATDEGTTEFELSTHGSTFVIRLAHKKDGIPLFMMPKLLSLLQLNTLPSILEKVRDGNRDALKEESDKLTLTAGRLELEAEQKLLLPDGKYVWQVTSPELQESLAHCNVDVWSIIKGNLALILMVHDAPETCRDVVRRIYFDHFGVKMA